MKAATFIADAGPKGKGAYAAATIERDTTIARLRGKPRWIWDIPEDLWPHTIQVDYDRYVLPKRRGVGWYINHSCAPNCVISGKRFVAERDIEEGEELTFDYSTDVDWAGFNMKCTCGSPRCRKVVRAYRFLPPELKERYGKNVAPFILRRYHREWAKSPGAIRMAKKRAAFRSI